MKRTKKIEIIESIVQNTVSFLITIGLQMLLSDNDLQQKVIFSACLTVVFFFKSYIISRIFHKLPPESGLKKHEDS